MLLMEEGQWAVWFWVLHLKKHIKNFESRVKDRQDVHGFEHQAGMGRGAGLLSLVGRGEL